jgi:V/A-type H+-transporting ATPase subunit K
MYQGVMTGIAIMIGAALVALLFIQRAREPRVALRVAIAGLLGANGLGLVASLGVMLVALSAPMPVLAEGTATAVSSGGAELGAALSTGLACIGAGIAVGFAGAAAIGAITEKPQILGRTLIFVGLAEGIAIYGLIISFMLLNR